MKSLVVCIISMLLLSGCAYQTGALSSETPAVSNNDNSVATPPLPPVHSTSGSNPSTTAAKMISPVTQ